MVGVVFFVKENRFVTTSFAILILLTYLNRKHSVKHKRSIYVGTLYVLGPVLDRVAGKLMIDTLAGTVIFETIIWNTLFLSFFFNDRQTVEENTPDQLGGCIWFYMVWVLSFML